MACASGKYECECCCASVTGLRGGIHPDYIKSISADSIGWALSEESAPPTRTFWSDSLIGEPIHIVSVTASLASIRRGAGTSQAQMRQQIRQPTTAVANQNKATPAMFTLFTTTQWQQTGGVTAANVYRGGFNAHTDDDDGRTYIATGALTSFAPSWQSPPDLFGYFCDGGLFVEINTPSDQYGVRLVVNYVDRLAFAPAYSDPITTLQHYWKCSHTDPFLESFYSGVSFGSHSVTGSGGSVASDPSEQSDYTNFDVSLNPFSTGPSNTYETEISEFTD